MQDYSRQVGWGRHGGGDEEGGEVNEHLDLLGEAHVRQGLHLQHDRNRKQIEIIQDFATLKPSSTALLGWLRL